MYPAYNQEDPDRPNCSESSAHPVAPDSDYGWEKLFSERLYVAYQRNDGITARVARYHNIFGPDGTWTGGKENAPAALCCKIAGPPVGGKTEIWGDGKQTRSVLYIDECVEGTIRLIRADFAGPANVGSEEMITINELAQVIMRLAKKSLSIRKVPVRPACVDATRITV
jgi:GDP-D-mannose 3', 5'-epimerase